MAAHPLTGPTVIDLSPVLSGMTPVWPGDVPVRRKVGPEVDGVVLSSLETTLHAGAHVDAPLHTDPDGTSIDALPLTHFVGPCLVVEVHVAPRGRVGLADVGGTFPAPRLLVKTGSFADAGRLADGFAGLAVELVEAAAAAGVVLIGIDTPSVDPAGDLDLSAHRALGRRGMAGLEGLDLSRVEPGRYTLVALPLRLEGAEASPVRAVLLPAGS